MVASRSAASCTTLGSVGSTSSPGRLSTGWGAVTTGRTASVTPASASLVCSASVTAAAFVGCSQYVHLPRSDGDLDS